MISKCHSCQRRLTGTITWLEMILSFLFLMSCCRSWGKIRSITRSDDIRSICSVPNVLAQWEKKISKCLSFSVQTDENKMPAEWANFSFFIMIYFKTVLPISCQIFVQKWATQEVNGKIFSSISLNSAPQFGGVWHWGKSILSCLVFTWYEFKVTFSRKCLAIQLVWLWISILYLGWCHFRLTISPICKNKSITWDD